MPRTNREIYDAEYFAPDEQFSGRYEQYRSPHEELFSSRNNDGDYFAPSRKGRQRRRPAKKGGGFGRFLLLLLLLGGLLLAAKHYGGFSLSRLGLELFGGESECDTENIVTDYLVDLDALERELPLVSNGYSPSEDDLYLLQQAKEQNPELSEKLELFTRHIGSFSQAAVRTIYLSPEKLDYVLQDPLHAGEDSTGGTSLNVKKGRIPLLMQYDSRWGNHLYGSGGMGNTGCGPTCLSMVAAGLTGNGDYSPDVVADFAEQNGYYIYGSGTSWSLFTEGADSFGLEGYELPLNESSMKTVLRQGGAVILSVSPGDFTFAGHFIVVSGYENGKYKICDPSSLRRSRELWSSDALLSQTVAAWGFRAR